MTSTRAPEAPIGWPSEIAPPEINACGRDFAVDGDRVRFGLAGVKGLGDKAIDAVLAARGLPPAARTPDFGRGQGHGLGLGLGLGMRPQRSTLCRKGVALSASRLKSTRCTTLGN